MTATSPKRVARERDLFLRLLQLGRRRDLGAVLEEALRLSVEATGARRGFIEVTDAAGEPAFSASHDCAIDEVEEIRRLVSSGIVAEAIATGRTIHTPSALLDARFSGNSSVRRNSIEAVLCVPVGGPSPVGVLYLQGRAGSGPFSADDVALAELFSQHLEPQVSRLLETRRAEADADPTRLWRSRVAAEALVGRTPAIADVLRSIALAAPLEVALLVAGPTGSGKSLVTRLIHDSSARRSKPFVEVSCAAYSDDAIDAEIFGGDGPGAIDAAEHGTLHLDEIERLPTLVQLKVLRLLNDRTYVRAADPTLRTADVRLLASTKGDPEELRARGVFRDDLYYRLNVVRIRLPALGERRSDIPLLAERVIEERSRALGVPRVELSPAARAALERAEWPGNVSQLANVVEAALIKVAGEGSLMMEVSHLFGRPTLEPPLTFHEATRVFQRDLLAKALDESNWSVPDVARRLDLAKSHTYTLIRIHGLSRRY
ncbi:MAG: sigma-54-dependent Fis family transcriptional regulator [Deltaproteobacteria bacterium]|nr:sigma-54-dependent Fis family transcriptional regulator [Deltaproteobacteria bacterium]